MAVTLQDDPVVTLKFGGGVNSAASEDDIKATECVDGQNFLIDLNNKNLRPRNPIELLGTAPNGQGINGFANLVDADGVSTILIQAGDTIYNWSSIIGFIVVGACDPDAKLRGKLEHYWPLDDVVIITDIALRENVLIWNGSALTEMTHNLGGDFKAKYCLVDDERAQFANIVSASVATPHLVATSELSDYQVLSTTDRPSSSLGAGDAFYILTPDLRPINGLMSFYDNVLISTEKGSMYRINGTDSTDTSISKFFPRSFATGDESLVYKGNDVIYGRIGKLQSIVTTDKFGDISTGDITSPIKDQLIDQQDWQMAYNPRTEKVYIHAVGQEQMWEYSKDLEGTELSPWVKLITGNAFSMNPQVIMTLIDPVDNLEYVFMGDQYGNLYRIEGTAGNADCGSNDIEARWKSGILKLPNEMIAEKVSGYISYRSDEDTEITLNFYFGGSNVSNDTLNVSLPGSVGGSYFGGEVYFGGDFYYGSAFEGRFRREAYQAAGRSEEIQVEVVHSGTAYFEINEICARFHSKTNP